MTTHESESAGRPARDEQNAEHRCPLVVASLHRDSKAGTPFKSAIKQLSLYHSTKPIALTLDRSMDARLRDGAIWQSRPPINGLYADANLAITVALHKVPGHAAPPGA
jgi:hypothetical protein